MKESFFLFLYVRLCVANVEYQFRFSFRNFSNARVSTGWEPTRINDIHYTHNATRLLIVILSPFLLFFFHRILTRKNVIASSSLLAVFSRHFDLFFFLFPFLSFPFLAFFILFYFLLFAMLFICLCFGIVSIRLFQFSG